MLEKHMVVGILLLTLLASCDYSTREVFVDHDQTPTAVRGVLATVVQKTATPIPILSTITPAWVEPTAAPTMIETAPLVKLVEEATAVPVLVFSDLHFALTADGAAMSEFPAGTDEVYAVWEYVGMSATDNIRRIWFRDDQIWLTREEGWNWGEFGSEGTVRHISVYDDEGSGLTPATYRLQLYVNDVLQGEAAFVILAP